jgi:hypothetical protein
MVDEVMLTGSVVFNHSFEEFEHLSLLDRVLDHQQVATSIRNLNRSRIRNRISAIPEILYD